MATSEVPATPFLDWLNEFERENPERAARLADLAQRLESHGLLDHTAVFIDTVLAARDKGKPIFGNTELSLRVLAVFSRISEQDAVPEAIRLLESFATSLKK